MDHESVVGGAAHVELDAVRSQLAGPPEGGERVLALDGGGPAVGDDRGHDGDAVRSLDALGASEKQMQSWVRSELLANAGGSP